MSFLLQQAYSLYKLEDLYLAEASEDSLSKISYIVGGFDQFHIIHNFSIGYQIILIH